MIVAAIVGCTGAGLLACLLLIVHRASVLACAAIDAMCGLSWIALAGLLMLGIAAGCTFGIARPMRATRLGGVIRSHVGSLFLIAGASVSAFTLLISDPRRSGSFGRIGEAQPDRIAEHAAAHACFFLAVLLLRPNARAISSTAWRLRENHENKQRLVTVIASLGVVLVGDAVLLAGCLLPSESGAVVSVSGELLVFTASCILAVALLGVLIDSLSIARTLWMIPVSFRDVVRRAAS